MSEEKNELPEVKWKHIDPEGVIAEQKKEIEVLRRLLVDKMLELEEMKEEME